MSPITDDERRRMRAHLEAVEAHRSALEAIRKPFRDRYKVYHDLHFTVTKPPNPDTGIGHVRGLTHEENLDAFAVHNEMEGAVAAYQQLNPPPHPFDTPAEIVADFTRSVGVFEWCDRNHQPMKRPYIELVKECYREARQRTLDFAPVVPSVHRDLRLARTDDPNLGLQEIRAWCDDITLDVPASHKQSPADEDPYTMVSRKAVIEGVASEDRPVRNDVLTALIRDKKIEGERGKGGRVKLASFLTWFAGSRGIAANELRQIEALIIAAERRNLRK